MPHDRANQHKRIDFPPFPPPPPGVVITPFKDFIPAGYARTVDEQGKVIEVDAHAGLPTVKLATEEEALQRQKEKKKRRHAGQCTDANGRLIPWWEEWEQGEHERTMSVSFRDGTFPCFADRVHQATDDFRVGRPWPQIALGVRSIWDHFRIYLGLLTSMPVYRRPKAKERRLDHPDVGYVNEPSEDEADHDMPRARHTINLSIVQDTLEQTAQPGKQLEPDNFEESSEQKQLFCAFTDDIEKGIMIFFGAYMRDSNLIWSEPNLFIAPTVLHFFLRFMLRNDVFYDSPSHTDNLIRAISVAELAIKELPLTAQIGQALPGKFDLACREHWGRRGNRSVHISAVDPVVDWARNEDSSGAPDVDAGVPPTSATSDDTEGSFQTWSSWTDVSVPSLCDILGQTQFAHEYAPWIVEHSTRRIHAVIPPMHQDQHDVAELGSEGVGALERRFARVILHPWVLSENEATEEFQAPVVVPVPCTCGPSDRDLNLPAPASTQEHAHTHGHGQGKEHDPYRDAVTLLVEPSHVPLLSVGMGLSGTWVGLGCASLAVRDEGERGTITDGGDYWYIEDLMSVFPSFYAESEGILGRVVQGAGDADDDVVD